MAAVTAERKKREEEKNEQTSGQRLTIRWS